MFISGTYWYTATGWCVLIVDIASVIHNTKLECVYC